MNSHDSCLTQLHKRFLPCTVSVSLHSGAVFHFSSLYLKVKNHRAITILLLFTFIFVDITLCSFTNKDNFVDSKNHGEQDLKKIQNFISQ